MNDYRFSKKRTVLLFFNLTCALFIYYNGTDDLAKNISLAVSILCMISLYDNLRGEKND